jgi:WD40 repeat protein
MADRIGQQLGNYRILRELGRGGSADVYLGEHVYLTSLAALKILHTSLDQGEVLHFLAEAQTLVRLRHPHIVRVLEYIVEQGTPVLVMDYASGGTVRKLYARGTRLPLPTVVDYVKQIASALHYAHGKRVIHRDVKPENLLLGEEQEILLSDFGLALLSPSPEELSTQEMSGTIPYMAPEQIRGKPEFASDQYALGVITYEWLCGRRPFEGSTWAVLRQHLEDPPPRLREQHASIPEEVEAVVLRALEKDPQQRFVSVQAFASALERASQASGDDEDVEITVKLRQVPMPSAPSLPDHTGPDPSLPSGVYLAAAAADDPFAVGLQAGLEAQGMQVWNGRHAGAQAATDREETMRQEIRAARLVALVLSPHTRASRTVKTQLQLARMYGRELLLIWEAGEEWAELLPDGWEPANVIDLVDARGRRYEEVLDEVAAHLEDGFAATRPLDLLPTAPRQVEIRSLRNPYKGLRAFTEADAEDFFGRERLIERLIEEVEGMTAAGSDRSRGSRLLTVIGPSGSGKSSIVQAGLLPWLRQGAIAGSENWVYLEPLVPGAHPVEALGLLLATYFPERSFASIREDLEDDSARGLHVLASQLVRGQEARRVVLLVDQFEELFTQTEAEDERRRFIDLILAAATEPRGPLLVVLTLRADFYDRPMRYPDLHQPMQGHLVEVLPMEMEELRATIEYPASLPDVQLIFEGTLVGDLLYEMQGQRGALPLLQFTLDQLFERRDGNRVTLEAYQGIGGVKGALTQHAERTFAALPSEEHRGLARVLFLRLIDPGVTDQDTTRRRASLAEFTLPDVARTVLLRETIDAFVTARLLVANQVGDTTTIEVSHEALIREWPRLSGWLREARDDILLQQTISADASEWRRRERPADRLYRETELAEARDWMARNTPSSDEVEFLQSSLAEQQRQQTEEAGRQARELSLQRRVVSRQRLLLAVLSLFSIVVIILGTLAEVGRQQADAQRQLAQTQALIARSRTLAAQANAALLNNQIDRALLLSVKANQTYNTYDARDSLLSALEYSPRLMKMLRTNFINTPFPEGVAIATLAFRPSEPSLLSFGLGGSGFLWNTMTGVSHALPLPCFEPSTTTCSEVGRAIGLANILANGGGVAISPDGHLVAVTGPEGLWIWNVETGTQVVPLEALPDCPPGPTPPSNQCAIGDFSAIAFSPDGKTLASSRCTQYAHGPCVQDRIRLWDMTSMKPTAQLLADQSTLAVDLAFSPDGKLLAASNENGTVWLWDIAAKHLVSQISTGNVISTGFSAEGENTGSRQAEDLAFSPSGKVLATTASNGTIRLWDIASGKPVGPPLVSPGGAVQQLAFSPDGKTLAASSANASIWLWDSTTSSLINQPLLGHTQNVAYLAFSPDGAMLASIDRGGTILLWNMTADSLLSQRLQPTSSADFSQSTALSSVVFSPNGKVIIAGNGTGQALLYDAQTGALLGTLDATGNPLNLPSSLTGGPPFDSDALTIESLAFSPDGHTLAAGRFDGTVFLWNWPSRKPLTHYRLAQGLLALAYSPDGHEMVSTYQGGEILLTDAASGNIIYTLATSHPTSGPTRMSTAAFSRDGTKLAAGEGSTVVIWDTRTGKRLGQPLIGHTMGVESVVFSPDGRVLASRESSGTIILWDAQTLKPIHQLFDVNQEANADLHSAGLVFSSDGSMLASATVDLTNNTFAVTLWDVASQEPVVHPFQEIQDQITGHNAVNSVVFSPARKQLAMLVTSDPRLSHISLWNIAIGAWQALACSIAGRNLTLTEWQQFAKDEPYTRVCSGFPADATVISYDAAQAHAAVRLGNRQEAAADYAQATSWAIAGGDAGSSNDVCWQGSLDQFAKIVLPACDYAVSSDPTNVDYHDSRGVARALVGDTRGAIADFTFVVQQANGYGDLSPQQIHERQRWLQALKKGQNPFDAKTLAALQQE